MTRWDGSDIPDMSGKTAIVTGGNCGLGFESARALADKGAQVILACRSLDKGEAAVQEISRLSPAVLPRVMQLDLQDLRSVSGFTRSFRADFDRLDLLMNNAGIMNTPYGLTEDGFERQMGTNHLGHFALTGQLLEFLRKTPGSRVVTVSSSGHRAGRMQFEDLLFEGGKRYTPLKAYGRSKLANLLFAYELQRHFERHGIDCASVAAHPGASQTNLGRHIEDGRFFRLFKPILGRVVQGADRGALPQIRASVDPEVRGGEYYGPDGSFEMSGYPIAVRSSKASRSLRDAQRLWQESERLTGVRYGFTS